MPVSVMGLTNINKGIIKLLPQIVTLIILITAIPQLAKLTWRVVFPVSPEDISALPLTASPMAESELKPNGLYLPCLVWRQKTTPRQRMQPTSIRCRFPA